MIVGPFSREHPAIGRSSSHVMAGGVCSTDWKLPNTQEWLQRNHQRGAVLCQFEMESFRFALVLGTARFHARKHAYILLFTILTESGRAIEPFRNEFVIVTVMAWAGYLTIFVLQIGRSH